MQSVAGAKPGRDLAVPAADKLDEANRGRFSQLGAA